MIKTFLLTVTLGTGLHAQGVLAPSEIARRALASTVVIVSEDRDGESVSLGSGFFVRNGLVVTNYHVVQNSSSIFVKAFGSRGASDELEIVEIDEKGDIAILRPKRIRLAALPLSLTQPISIGDEVFVVGSPEGLEGTFSQGIVSAIRGTNRLQITAPISHGSSGGPVLNRSGEVVGIAVGAKSEGQNLNFAIPVQKLVAVLARINVFIDAKKPSDGDWLVILGSFSKTRINDAKSRHNLVKNMGYDARIENSNKFPNLKAGLWVVVLGPFEKDTATAIADKLKIRFVDTYIKAVQ